MKVPRLFHWLKSAFVPGPKHNKASRLEITAGAGETPIPSPTRSLPLAITPILPRIIVLSRPELTYPLPLTGNFQFPNPRDFIDDPKWITPEMLAAYALHPNDQSLINEINVELVRLCSLAGGETLSLGSTARGTFLPNHIDFDIMTFSPAPLSSAQQIIDTFQAFPRNQEKLQELISRLTATFHQGKSYELVVRPKYPDWRYCRFSLDLKLPDVTIGFADINYIATGTYWENAAGKRYFDGWKSTTSHLDQLQKETLLRNIRMARHILASCYPGKIEAMYVEQMVLESRWLLQYFLDHPLRKVALSPADYASRERSFDTLLEYIHCREMFRGGIRGYNHYLEFVISRGFEFKTILEPREFSFSLTGIIRLTKAYHEAKLRK